MPTVPNVFIRIKPPGIAIVADSALLEEEYSMTEVKMLGLPGHSEPFTGQM